MAVLNPIRVVLAASAHSGTSVEVPDFPFDPTRGSHSVPLGDEIFIDKSDFRMADDPDYFGLAPGKCVGLKYAFVIRCDSVETDAAGR